MSFTITRLQDDRVIVAGADTTGHENTTVIDGHQWFEHIKADTSLNEAVAEFEAATAEFYAPLAEAADKLAKAKAGKVDELDFIVLQEGKAGTQGQDEVLVQLNHDSKVLRLIEEDASAPRLIWVANGDKVSLEILAAAPATAPKPDAGIHFTPSENGTVPANAN